MKYLRRYLSLLFALVMSVSVFSITAHAESADTSKYQMYISYGMNGTTYGGTLFSDFTDKTFDYVTGTVGTSHQSTLVGHFIFSIANKDASIMFQGGRPVSFTMENVITWYGYNNNPNWVGGHSYQYYLEYADATTSATFDAECIQNTKNPYPHNIKFTITPDKDVKKVHIVEKFNFHMTNIHGTASEYNTYLGFFNTNGIKFVVERSSEEAGLLSKISSGISDMFNAIKELPQKIWELISEGLKNLFVPSAEDMAAYKDKWDELLSSRLGAVYQVVNILTDSWDGVMNADQTDTIEFPQATLNFGNTSFTFGGYSVKIVPDGFSVLVTAIKSIVAILCTIAFVNGLRKRYDEIMGVQS